MSTWVITLIVVVVVGLGLVWLTLASRARRRRGASGAIGLPPIGALSGVGTAPTPVEPEREPEEEQSRGVADLPDHRTAEHGPQPMATVHCVLLGHLASGAPDQRPGSRTVLSFTEERARTTS